MNKFIVWDKTLKCFHLDGRVKLENGTLKPIGEDYTIHNNIGLKDINGKSIYADCSIVEFIAKRLGKANIKIIGIFKYCNVSLRYNIELLISIGDYNLFAFDNINMSQFEIIDTIQENKLGLIKED